jgi:iron(III) transport system ATP-binding protein
MSAIELTGVTKRFGKTPVLDSIDLSVPEGSRTVIVGSSGSGKTTLLRLLSGFEVPDSGTIGVAGRVMAGPDGFVPAHRRSIGYVSQDGSLFPHLTVGENVAFGLKGSGHQDSVRRLLEMVSLDPAYAKRRPDQLSGGQQQRVALARALARRPRVMLLDEPFSALDAGLRAATRDSVADLLTSHGVTTVLVTHDQAEALSFAHQLAILRDGRLVQVGTPRELYSSPSDLRTGLFLGDAIVLPGTVHEHSVAACALGTVQVAPGAALGPATLMLRPEQITVEEGSGEETGTVEAVDFHGPDVVLTIRIGGQVIRVPQRSNRHPPVGSAVRVAVSGRAIAYGTQAPAVAEGR